MCRDGLLVWLRHTLLDASIRIFYDCNEHYFCATSLCDSTNMSSRQEVHEEIVIVLNFKQRSTYYREESSSDMIISLRWNYHITVVRGFCL